MDLKITRNDIKNNCSLLLGVGYEGLNYLLRFKKRVGYNVGVYGWNYDYYNIPLSNGVNIGITTGYRPLNGNIIIDYKDINYYNNQARDILSARLDYNIKEILVNELLDSMLLEFYRRGINNEKN